MKASPAKAPVIMVHGAFCGGWAFESFRKPFEAAGHAVLTPDLRGHGDGTPSSAVVGLSMSDYAGAVADLVRAQPAPPILVGHSMGGLVAMMAAAKAEVAALVLLAPSPPWGIAGGTLEEAGSAMALYALGPFWAQAVEPDRFVAGLYSLDRMEPSAAQAVSKRMRAESGRALFETLNWWLDPFMTTSVSPGAIKAPVFAAVGERDLINPPSTVRQTAAKFGCAAHVFAGMSHWVIGEPGWEDVAAACLAWIGGVEAKAA
jgi:pimeloyl-ACP methyl ester carboxylesterase